MSRYYECPKCQALVKENTDCIKCVEKPKSPTLYGVPTMNPNIYWPDPDDANYTDDNGTGD